MKIKAKITSTIMSMMLALGVMGFAVYAAATQTLTVNNTVSFVSDHVLARITGDVAGATGGIQIDPEALDYDKSVTSSNDVSNAFPKWEIGDVEFAVETAPITITINIYNLSKERSLTFSLETVDGSLWNGENLGDDSNSNITRSVKYSTTNQTPATNQTYVSGDVEVEKEKQATIIITLNITDTGRNVNDFDNSFNLELNNVGENNGQPEESTEGFVYNPQSKGLTIPANESLTYENMPETVLNGASAFYGFYRDYNETTNLFENKVNLPYRAGASSELVYARLESAPAEFDVTPNLDGWTLSLNQNYYKDHLELPVMINGIPVTELKNGMADSWNSYIYNVTTIDIPEYVHNLASDMFNGTDWENNMFNEAFASNYDIDENGILYLGKVAYRYVSENDINGTIALREDTLGIADFVFWYRSELTSISLPNNLITIGSNAFADSGLSTLSNVPNTLMNVDNSAFNNTPWLNGLPNGMNYLGNIAYKYVGETVTEPVVFNPETKVIASSLFGFNEGLTQITIPSSVLKIGDYAFTATKLTSITIPSSVLEIGEMALATETLQTVSFEPNSKLKTIASYLFHNTQLRNITIPASVEIIGESAFDSSLLESVLFEQNSKLHTIEMFAFQNTQLTSLTSFPNSLINVHGSAFDGTPWFNNLTGNDVHYVGKVAYKYVGAPIVGIISLDPQTLAIEAGLFAGQSQLTSIALPATLIKIGEGALSFTGLTSIVIPANVEIIGGGAFTDNYHLSSIQFAANSKLSRMEGAFALYSNPNNILINELVIPASVNYIHPSEFYQLPIKNLVFEKGSQIKEITDNVFSINVLESVDFGDNSNLEIITNSAFSNVINLTSINFGTNSKLRMITNGAFTALAAALPMETLTIPASVEEISSGAFGGSKIKNIVFEDGSQIKEIADNVFSINVLESVDFGDNSSLEVLHGGAFSGVSKLSSINFGANSKLRVIRDGAFEGLAAALQSPMETLTIPASVEEISNGAFGMDAKIKNIVFEDNSKLVKLDSGNRMFASSALESVSFGLNSSLKEIGAGVFYFAVNLQSLVIPSSVTHVEPNAFVATGITTITIPSGLMKLQQALDEFGNPIYGNNGPIYELSSEPVDKAYLFGNPEADVTINFHPAG